jgi:A/G-specific adenine glycosylase
VLIVKANDHVVDSRLLGDLLLQWGQDNFREFPWRATTDPYKLLMCEVMLHRTQAIQVVPVYERFIAEYPNTVSLAKATKDELHDILYSLGLRWRIDLIHQMAAELIDKWEGQIPVEQSDLLSLPGVSEYIAGAVRCFAWNLPEPLADTNTVRIVGRLFGLEAKDSSRRSERFRELLKALVHLEQPRTYNHALLDLADKVCRKKHPPDCYHCPLQKMCYTGLATLAAE